MKILIQKYLIYLENVRLIKPEAELLLQQPGLEGVYKQIELAGRTCYKSTDKITEDSAKPFVDRMIKSKHLAMLEHGTVYLCVNGESELNEWGMVDNSWPLKGDYQSNKYSKINYQYYDQEPVGSQKDFCKSIPRSKIYITTNLRVLVENDWMDDLKYICEPTEYHEKRYTFRVITSIGVTREFNRHRTMSIAEQSTRYCNYSKDKFGGEVTFCIPFWTDLKEGSYEWKDYFGEYTRIDLSCPLKDQLVSYLFTASKQYLELIDQGWPPQESREVLPLCTATEAVYTAFASDWQHFFDLRYFGKTGVPHPNMVELAGLMAKEASKNGIWNELCTENVEMAN